MTPFPQNTPAPRRRSFPKTGEVCADGAGGVLSLAELLSEEMQARGWTIEDGGGRMGVCGAARDTLHLALTMAVQRDNLLIGDDFFDGLARAFDVSPHFFRNIHARWLAHPEARQPYSVPDELFGPWLRAALAPAQGGPAL